MAPNILEKGKPKGIKNIKKNQTKAAGAVARCNKE